MLSGHLNGLVLNYTCGCICLETNLLKEYLVVHISVHKCCSEIVSSEAPCFHCQKNQKKFDLHLIKI